MHSTLKSVSSLCRGHANLLCIVPIFSYVTPKGTIISVEFAEARQLFSDFVSGRAKTYAKPFLDSIGPLGSYYFTTPSSLRRCHEQVGDDKTPNRKLSSTNNIHAGSNATFEGIWNSMES